MKTKLLYAFVTTLVFFGFSDALRAQITVTDNQTALQLVQQLTGSGVTITNATLVCPTGGSAKFGGVSNLGIDSGIVLTSGRARTASGIVGVNGAASLQAANQHGAAGDAALNTISGGVTEDACKLEFDIVPQGDTLKFQYVFGSEEFPSFTCSEYNDAFAFIISGPGFPANNNIAVLPNTTTPVTINNLHCTNAPYNEIGRAHV